MERSKVLGIPVVKPLLRELPVTSADLQKLKAELLTAIQVMLTQRNEGRGKKWLKTYEVKKLLGISSGTLQTLRNSGNLPYSKIGGILYYDMDEVNKMIEAQKRDFKSRKQHK